MQTARSAPIERPDSMRRLYTLARAVGLARRSAGARARPHQEVELLALHALLEQTEPRLLPRVQQLIHRGRRAPQLLRRRAVLLVERLHTLAQHTVVRAGVLRQHADLLQRAIARARRLPPDLLEPLE